MIKLNKSLSNWKYSANNALRPEIVVYSEVWTSTNAHSDTGVTVSSESTLSMPTATQAATS